MLCWKHLAVRLALASLSLVVPTAHAELIDRGGGLLYDTVLNVTWLQDANYAQTSGFDVDGRLGSDAAFSWAANLTYYHAPTGQLLTAWRLPKVQPINGTSFNYDNRFDGTSDNGYNISSPSSELGYMFYVNLHLTGARDVNGNVQSPCCVPAPYTEAADVGLVKNLRNFAYWAQTPYEGQAPGYFWWVFSMNRGSQDPYENNYPIIPWAVTDGDIAVVPEPASTRMLLVGFALIGARYVRKAKA